MPPPAPLRTLERRDHHVRRIPVLALMTHSRCNCRCLMYDIWKGNRAGASVERPDRLRQLGHYYLAVQGLRPFPPIRCAAPWVSTVIEVDGTVRPCFFHAPIGNIHSDNLEAILNSENAVAFRRNLDMRRDPICSRCVCTFNL